jgi:exonuclease III
VQTILTFKLEHGDFSATIIQPAAQTLEMLAESILDAVGFDMDHAYGFHDNLRNPYRSEEEYTLFADMGEEAKKGDTGVRTTPLSAVFRPGKRCSSTSITGMTGISSSPA